MKAQYELTDEEVEHYATYGLIDICDLCGKIKPIHNHNDGEDYLEYGGNQLLCRKCRS